MTGNYPRSPGSDYAEPAVPGAPPAAGQVQAQPQTKDVAKEQVAGVGHGAAEAGQHAAGVAKEQAAQVASEAGRQAKGLAQQAQHQLREQAGAQQQKLASGLHSLSDELHSLASTNDAPGVASDMARQAAGRTGALAGWLDGREPSDVLDEVASFARRRPGAFLAAAAGLGFLAGRLTRGLQGQASGSDSDRATSNSPPAYPRQTSAPRRSPYATPSSAPYPTSSAPYPEVPPVPPVVASTDPIPEVPPVSPQEFPSTGYLGEDR